MLARVRRSIDDRDRGFTLIELLVVVIIIGILAAIAVPLFLNQRKKAVEASEKSDLRWTADEMESFFIDAQTYPTVAQVPDVTKTTAIGSFTWNAVKVSKGNTVTITTSTANGYCLDASNTNTSIATWHYDSTRGGLLPGTC